MKYIPSNTERGLDLYVNEGVRPGSFLYALLSNNLIDACRLADSENAKAIHEIVMWCYCNIPGNSWGSVEAVEKWLKDFVPEVVR